MLKQPSWQAVRESRLFGFARFLYQRFNEVDVPQVSASLTFTSLLALVPVLTVALVILSAFPVFNDLSSSVIELIDGYLVPKGADAVRGYLATFQNNAGNLTAIGIVFLGVTAVMLIRTIDQTFNRIWRAQDRRPLWTQFLVYWMLLTFAPLAVGAGLSVWELLLRHQVWANQDTLLSEVIKTVGGLVMNAAALWLLYRVVPNRYVPARHALIGAALTAVLLDLAQRGFGWYVGTFNSYTLIYGAFAAIPVFLIWLNLLWMLLLTGAVLTASLSYWQDDAFRRSFRTHGRFDDVLKILLMLYRAQNEGQALCVQDFRSRINMGYDELGDLLEKLARHGYVYQGQNGWVLKTNAEHIGLDELFKLFVYRPARTTQDAVGEAVSRILTPGLESMNMSLAEFERQTRKEERNGQAV